MKKLITFLFCLVLGISAIAQQKIQLRSADRAECTKSDMTGLQASFSFSSLDATEIETSRGEFSEIHIDGSYPNGNVGEPQLPMFTRLIAIPTGATPVVTVDSYSEKEYTLSEYGIGKVAAMQAPVRKNIDPSTVEYAYSEAAYSRDSYNDDPIAMVEELGTMRGITLGRIIVQPVRYNPAAGTVKVYNDIEVSVRFPGGDAVSTEQMFKSTCSHAFQSVYDQIFNINMLMGDSRDAYTDHPDKYNTPVKMLVICYSGFQGNSALNSWLEWKLQKGYYVDIYYTGSGSNNAGTTASAIASFIKTKYNASVSAGNAYTYLIVIGDTGQVPQYMNKNIDSDIGNCASDLGYAAVNFTTSNTTNYFPDMYYSRISVENTTHLTNYLNKVLTYEKYEFTDGGNYLNNVILVGGWDSNWTPKVAKPTINYGTNYYFKSSNTTYGGFGSGTIKATVSTSSSQGYSGSNNGVYQGINNGACFVNYTAHGDKQEWTQPLMTAAQVATLSNTGKYFFGVGNCCLTGNFNSTMTTYSPGSAIGTNACFAETMIRVPNAGAVAYLGCSPYSYWYEDFYWAVGAHSYSAGNYPTNTASSKGVYDVMFQDQYWNSASALLYLGNLAVQQAVTNGNQTSSITDGDTRNSAHYYFQFYHTFGDGSVMPYITKPEANTVTIPSTVTPGTTSITVNAVAGSYVAVTDNSSVIYGVAEANSNGVATVNFTNAIPSSGDLHVVVTRQQYQPYFGTITVQGGTQYTITANVNNAAWGSVTGGGQLYEGATCTLTATANHGYAFEKWSDNNTDNPRSFTVTGNATYTANFRQLTQHHCTYTAQQTNGTIGVSPANAYAGDIVTLTATPAAGYVLDHWEVNTVSKGGASGNDFRSLLKAISQKDKSTASNGIKTAGNKTALSNLDRLTGNRGNVEVIDNQFIMPDSEVTISAVFREESVADITYDLVTESQTDWSGNYVLATSLSSTSTTVYAFDGDTEDNAGGFTGVTVDNNSIVSIGNAAVLTIAKSTVNSSYYSIRINGGDYLADGTNGIETMTAESSEGYTNWSITYTSNGIQIYCPIWNGGPYYFYFVVYEEISSGEIAGAIYLTTDGSTTSTDTYNLYYILPNLYKEHNAQEQGLTVYDGTATNQYIPMYGYYFDNYTKSEFIIPASQLTVMNGCTVSAITFYPSSVGTTNSTWSNTSQTVFLKEVSGTTLGGSYSGTSGATTVKEGLLTMPTAGTAYTITFDTPYTYNGGDLLIGVYNTAKGSYNKVEWYGTSGLTSGVSAYGNNSSSLNSVGYNAQSFLPKTTFTYLLAGHNVTAGTMSNGSVQFSINGGYDWYNSLTNVAAGETVVISVDPEQGFELSGAPTVTPSCTVTGSGNLYSFTMPDSNVTVNATFNCTTPADPTFSVATGTYTTAQHVSISCATAGATIYYTTDGSTPTDSSTQYSEAITILETTTLKAIAYIGTCASNVTTATYTMELPTYTVTCATGLTGGSIVANHATAAEGITVTVTATPESGYFFGTITATDANYNDVPVTINGNEGTFTMPAANVTVTATFTTGYSITLNQTDHGTISADQTTNLAPGTVVTLTATPDNGCVFLAWYAYKTGNPRDLVAVISNQYILMPASDVTVQAIFVTEEEYGASLGSGTSTNQYIPTYVRARYSLTQQIYLASELNNQKGRITKIAYRATTTAATRNLTIYMAHTDLSSFSSTTGWETMGSVAKVFEGNVAFSTSDWTTITLDTPFEYDGTSNINICVVDNTNSTAGSNNRYTQFYRYSATNRALYANGSSSYANTVGYSNQLSSTTGTRISYVSQMHITMMVPGSAESLTLSPGEMADLSYVENHGPSRTNKLDIVGVDLQNNITLNAPTNFEISLTEDGTYASSVTVQRETGSKGNRIDVRTITSWGFEDGLDGWTAVDSDNDGYGWVLGSACGGVYLDEGSSLTDGHTGTGLVVSGSYSNVSGDALTPDNWLISPQINELGGSFSMWAKAQQAAYPAEHFGIYVSTTGTNPSDFTLLDEWTLTSANWKQFSVDLGLYTGQQGYIAVRHFNCTDQFMIDVDDFELDTDASITIEMPVVITPATVFVRMKENLNPGNYSGTLTGSAGTGDNLNGSVSLSGEVIAEYDVTLAANPVAGGSIAGAGSYPAGTEVTVAARTNTNYHFVNWTENGNPVSTDASYTFTISADRDLVANFELDTFVIAATANPAAGGAVSGTGTFDYGTSVTVHATVVAGYTFVNWTENDVEVSTNADYTFTVEADRTLVANFELATVDQEVVLSEGYNWFVPTIDMTLAELEIALGDKGISIMSQEGTVVYDDEDEEWIGDLDELVPGQLYIIQVNDDCNFTLNGNPMASVTITITIVQGYNWFGYIGEEMSIMQALGSFIPAEGDNIFAEGDEGTAVYDIDDEEWIGDLLTLKPNHGYIYYSNDPTPKQITFTLNK